MQGERTRAESERTRTETRTEETNRGPTATPPPKPDDEEVPFFSVLITPKLTFSLRRRPDWRVVEDIPQAELQEAFLSRFPVRIDADKLAFKCATPALSLSGQERLVYRINSANGGDDERVLLQILSSLDKAYSAKYEKMLEEARADLLSSSMSFQVVLDEVRAGQAAISKRWESDVKSLKEQQSTNQKRLFLLEREKEGLQRTVAATDEVTSQLRSSVQGLTMENAALRQRQAELETQLHTLREAFSASLVSSGEQRVAAAAAPPPHALAEVACQTAAEGGAPPPAEARMAMERWQQQMTAMSDWLRTGAALLHANAGAGASPPTAADEAAAAEPAAGGEEDEPSSVC